jgi:hypothetical protein
MSNTFGFFVHSGRGETMIYEVVCQDGKVRIPGFNIWHGQQGDGCDSCGFFRYGGRPYGFFMYSSLGVVRTAEVVSHTKYVEVSSSSICWYRQSHAWKGWDSCAFFEYGGKPYGFFMRSSTGEIMIYEVVSEGGKVRIPNENQWAYQSHAWKGWDSCAFFSAELKPPKITYYVQEEFRCRMSDWAPASGGGATEEQAIKEMVEYEKRVCVMIASEVSGQRNRVVEKQENDQ